MSGTHLYGQQFSNGVLFAYHLVVDVPGGSSNLCHWKAYPPGLYPATRVNKQMVLILAKLRVAR